MHTYEGQYGACIYLSTYCSAHGNILGSIIRLNLTKDNAIANQNKSMPYKKHELTIVENV